MEQTRNALLQRRDNIFTDNPFLAKSVVIESIFTAAFLVVVGLCTRVLILGRGSRLVYALLLSSSIFYVIDLCLVIAENVTIVTVSNADMSLHTAQAEEFFGALAFPLLFASAALAAVKRYFFVSGITGHKIHKFDPIVATGTLIATWLTITSLVLAGCNIALFDFEFDTILEGPTLKSLIKQINRINNVGYVRSAALCVGCLYIIFSIVYTYLKMRRNEHFHDEVTKWMAFLVMPAVVMNFFYVLIFTILLSPKVSSQVFQTFESVNAIELADEVVSPGIPFLISLALVAIGLKHMVWKHSTTSTEGFVPMNDWPTRKLDAEAPFGVKDV
ncbi:hypothetical protein SCHPADRAFT_994804 [Schizopora paradoxa]|uniref:Uncharacterized protein n=1 Tax=Schizopora paradoxa TaxID=27342 RepID=A0A0H2SIA4_9AGAM|nr:hypothetical protein SCHPADRAFT_994804 [Schizopora paradoxa]